MDRVMKLPVGIDNFCKIRQDGYYYTDKTRLIEQFLRTLVRSICSHGPVASAKPSI